MGVPDPRLRERRYGRNGAAGANRQGENARGSAVYFPWVWAADPLHRNAQRPFPPCGFVAGIFTRTDASRGVWHAPAGINRGVVNVRIGFALSKPAEFIMLNIAQATGKIAA
jgi:phage tail sheath protein FI